MSSCEAGRTGAYDRHFLAGPHFRDFGFNPAVLETVVDDGTLDVLNGNGQLVDA